MPLLPQQPALPGAQPAATRLKGALGRGAALAQQLTPLPSRQLLSTRLATEEPRNKHTELGPSADCRPAVEALRPRSSGVQAGCGGG